MEPPKLSPAKTILLAVQLATKSDILGLRTLVTRHPKTLHNELVLRILLSHLPESIDSSEYVPFLQTLSSGTLEEDKEATVDKYAFAGLGDVEAQKKVRKLGLLPLVWPDAPADAPADHFVQFLIHRSLRIDEYTGFLTQIPGLLAPFLHISPYLRTWFISSVLPLLRLSYEYHPQEGTVLTIPKFESLDDQAGVSLLLAGIGKGDSTEITNYGTIGRDLKGLVGPWMYGDTRWKRRKLREESAISIQAIEPLDTAPAPHLKCLAWEEVFKWIIDQAASTWKVAVSAVEQWDGPGDVDLGGYEDGTIWLDEDDQQHLERRYARAAIAAAYLISEESQEALHGVHRILTRINTLLDKDRIPTLQAAAALLDPVPNLDRSLLVLKNISFLRNGLLEDYNVLTRPNGDSIALLHALLISSFICTRIGCHLTVKRAAELVLVQEISEQKAVFTGIISRIRDRPKNDDKYWITIRNELLWLHSWGASSTEGADTRSGRGILGSLPKSFIESEILSVLLANTRYALARSIYEMAAYPPLSQEHLHDTIISAAMTAYDNATNGNKTRGGVKKCHDILHAFPDTLQDSIPKKQADILVDVTHILGNNYRLVLKKGEPFKPVQLRVHADPISIIGKVLEQNQKSYINIPEMIDIGRKIIRAGLTIRNADGGHPEASDDRFLEEEDIAQRRIVAMCIDAALAEDDFETAYSFIATRLRSIAGPAESKSGTPTIDRKDPITPGRAVASPAGLQPETIKPKILTTPGKAVASSAGLQAERPPKVIDDWSWRAALQAGKYRRNALTTRPPSRFGSPSENLDIRHVEQRMDCLAQALRLAPRATLHEILNVYRRCEEELEAMVKEEAEREAQTEAAWDGQNDAQGAMPGAFSSTPTRNATTTRSRMDEEAPVSLFDLSREGIARAQSGLSALSILRGANRKDKNAGDPLEAQQDEPPSNTPRMRKRDQLKNAAVGGLATSVGWLIGAQPASSEDDST